MPSCCGPAVNPRISSPDGSYDPRQPQFRIPRKVVKGGSHICAPNYCLRYRPAARQPQMIDTGMSHLGFRCIVRNGKKAVEEVSAETHSQPAQPTLGETLGSTLKRVVRQVRIIRKALVHPRVPWHAKVVAGCSLVYVFSPIQLIPNFIPIIGQMDDVLVIGLGIKYLRRHVPQSVLDDCESDSRASRKRKVAVTPVTAPLPHSQS